MLHSLRGESLCEEQTEKKSEDNKDSSHDGTNIASCFETPQNIHKHQTVSQEKWDVLKMKQRLEFALVHYHYQGWLLSRKRERKWEREGEREFKEPGRVT